MARIMSILLFALLEPTKEEKQSHVKVIMEHMEKLGLNAFSMNLTNLTILIVMATSIFGDI